MIWQKVGLAFPETTRYYPQFEYMFIWSKGKPYTTNLIRDRLNTDAGTLRRAGLERSNDGTKDIRPERMTLIKPHGVRYNVWQHRQTCGKKPWNHPATFPINLVRDHILSWSNPGELVFDPFMGTGTTGIGAAMTGRNFVGCEIDAEHFTWAEYRIGEAYDGT